jgi:2,4-dichlorophenol 6-monooxygenase
LPHAWLTRGEESISTHHLLVPGRFLLLAASGGERWCDAARQCAGESGIAIDSYRIGHGCELGDRDGDWSRLRQHDDTGAILVRPDGHVAFRARGGATDPSGDLDRALRTALGLEYAAAVTSPAAGG